MLIQLQRLDPTTNENLGGLYINVDHVSAVYYDLPSRHE
jgi:hypothetical protein